MKIKKLHYQIDAQVSNAQVSNAQVSAETCLNDIRRILPAVDALLSRYGTTRLRDYVAQLDQQAIRGFQCNQDFIAEVSSVTGELLGPKLGTAIAEDLHERPQVLTANHHGIDTFAQSTQSNLLFSMRQKIDGKPAATIPVLACGSVPLNNLTYPRGFLIYASQQTSRDSGICKLPLFPDSYKRKLVSVTGPFTAEMLNRSRARAAKLVADNKVDASIEAALNAVFDDFTDIGEAHTGYVEQATLVNHRLWRHLFRDRSCRSELVYIELESIAGRLLKSDLFDTSTICHQLFFDSAMRAQLIEQLNGQRGCWQYEALLERCSGPLVAGSPSAADSAQGTMFFWGVDAKGRKIPLVITQAVNGAGVKLRGFDDGGQLLEIPFTPADVAQGVQDGRLLPSIFTSYLLISIARGISCIGGYYQADYLPVMRKAVIETLRGSAGETVRAIDAAKLRPELYLSGMQTIGLKTEGQILPAGPLEIIASGGLSAEQYERIGELTVLQSHIASLYDTFMDVVPQGPDSDRAKKQIARLVHDAVGGDILTISMR